MSSTRLTGIWRYFSHRNTFRLQWLETSWIIFLKRYRIGQIDDVVEKAYFSRILNA